METPQDKTIFSGIQPSGALHIGNYLGAIKQWLALQENNNAYYCIVDEHAITVPYDPEQLPSFVLDTVALYLAVGLDPEKSTIFVQSHVPAHTKLAWLLATQTPLGELNRMTQYKEKSDKSKEQSSLGLLAYPVLQAADILLYQTDLVPVGEDQIQHIELTRDIAKRFNNKFGDTFTIPKPLINKGAARIMSLSDPTSKMSKSDDNPKSYISLTDTEDDIRKKISSATTETEPVISFTESGPAVKNLLNIYAAFSKESQTDIESKFEGKGYKEFKEAIADIILAEILPLQERFNKIRSNEDELYEILSKGAEQAATAANETIQSVQEKMGLI
jgi:tryptophanyl-tRNA synthetase